MASLRIVVSPQNRVFKGHTKIAALAVSSKITCNEFKLCQTRTALQNYGQWERECNFFYTIDLEEQITNYLPSDAVSISTPPTLLSYWCLLKHATVHCLSSNGRDAVAIRPRGLLDHQLLCWWNGTSFISSLSCFLHIPGDSVFVPFTESTDKLLLNSLVKV